MSPLASSLHEDSDLQQDSESNGLPDSSDTPQEGSEGGDDMTHLGDDADSARTLALQQSPSHSQVRGSRVLYMARLQSQGSRMSRPGLKATYDWRE